MDRKTCIKILICLCILALYAAPVFSIADTVSANDGDTVIAANTSGATTPASQNVSGSHSRETFPHLQRALIIATIVNFVLILFALSVYFAKRKMKQIAPLRYVKEHQDSQESS